jgi:hypothetical protein
MKDQYYPDAQQILDFNCLKESINYFAKTMFNNCKNKYQKWSKNIIMLFKTSKIDEAIGLIKAFNQKKCQ